VSRGLLSDCNATLTEMVERLACPDCGQQLCRFERPRGFFYDCGQCGGQFIEHAALAALLDESRGARDTSPKHTARLNPLQQKVRYRPCAMCPAMMNRKNFGGASGIIVDVCALHGMWFDRGELDAVLSFVAQGGLERAHAYREQRARHDASMQAWAASRPVALSSTPDFDPMSLSDLGEGVIELIEFLHDVLSSSGLPNP
jgi:Zn-finger nucleic acid-binding protein